MSIATNIGLIKKRLKELSQSPVTLIAVTKNRSLAEIQAAIKAGITDIAENRVQEAAGKLPQLPNNITCHFIGHLQSNKIKKALQLFDVIQSVDSLELANNINTEASKISTLIKDKLPFPIFLQINIAEDPKKFGFKKAEIIKILPQIIALPYLNISGLMTIIENTPDITRQRQYFREMKELFDNLKKHPTLHNSLGFLSMGMSQDYESALLEGSNMTRLGSAIFE